MADTCSRLASLYLERTSGFRLRVERQSQNGRSASGTRRAKNRPKICASGSWVARMALAARKCAPVVNTSSTIAMTAGSGVVRLLSMRYRPSISSGLGRLSLPWAVSVLSAWTIISRTSGFRLGQMARSICVTRSSWSGSLRALDGGMGTNTHGGGSWPKASRNPAAACRMACSLYRHSGLPRRSSVFLKFQISWLVGL